MNQDNLPECVRGKCCSESLYDVKKINSWEALRDLYYKCEDRIWKRRWIFRGHQDSTWCLMTPLEKVLRKRFKYDLQKAKRWECRLLRQFMRIAPMFLTQPPDKKNWMEWLALLRHYGGPTRLMDWTYSFWIAVFFAVEKAENGKSCAVWALDVDWAIRRVRENIPALDKILKKEGSNSQAEFDFIFRSKKEAGIWPVNPFRLNERLHAQQGLFLLSMDATRGFMDNLHALDSSNQGSKHLCKITIECDEPLLSLCLSELQRMNIHSQTLFRGLGGLARDLENQILMPHLFQGIEEEGNASMYRHC